jgi:hypothetical protein
LLPCPIRNIFGIRCPGCGMTRAFVAMSSGNMPRAWRHNPFSFIVVPLLAWGIVETIRSIAQSVSSASKYGADGA